MTKKSAMLIGGGITSMQDNIDLWDIGFKVYLVEKTPRIRGNKKHRTQIQLYSKTLKSQNRVRQEGEGK